MTDFFALLAQAKQPWLEADKLKEAFHEKSRVAHPDAGGSEAAFAQVNEAYQVLLDPRRRLQHLLALENQVSASAGQAVASDIADLFQSVAAASQEAEAVLRKLSAASNSLSRSLLQSDLRGARGRLEEMSTALQKLQNEADDELKTLNDPAAATSAGRVADLQRLAGRFAYLTRWTAEIEEKRAQLAPF